MKNLYIQCNMGAAGDMLMGALLELVADKEEFANKINSLGIPGVAVEVRPSVKCGITGTHVAVTVNGEEEESHDHDHEHHHDQDHDQDHDHHHDHDHDHHHEHHHEHEHNQGHHHHGRLGDISLLINGLDISDKVKKDAQAIYETIAKAESQVHGQPMDEIHFHEVGTLDAVADVVGNCILMEMIGADKVTVSPIHVGSGQVKCAHGILPVPAPATAIILEGMPIYSGDVKGELCTPTGAAILKHFADEFGNMPAMVVEKTGYGMGNKDFTAANCVRAMVGTGSQVMGEIVKLECNLDDMSGEAIGFAMDALFDAGALDVYTTPIGMKKSRPAVMLSCLGKAADSQRLAALMLEHTTTIRVMKSICERYTLERHEELRKTPWGDVRVKVCQGYGVKKAKAEHDDVAKIAKENGISIGEVLKEIEF